MGQHVIFITFDGLTDPLGQSQILPYVTGLSRRGFIMHVISCEKEHRIVSAEKELRAQLAAENMTWEYLIYEEDGGILSRISYLRALRKKTGAAIRSRRPALIHCRSYLAAMTGLHFSRKMKIPFVFDMRGLWADERMDGGIWTRKNPLHMLMYHFFKKKESAFVKESAAIISLTERGKTELQNLYPDFQPQNKTTVIPCCTDTTLFDPAKAAKISVPGLKHDGRVLVYSGSIGTWYCTSEMIDCVLNWHQKIPGLQLLVLTRDTEAFEKILREKTVPEGSIIVASARRTEMPQWLALAEAAIFFIKPVYSKLASSPTKMAECWSMGLPVITNSGIGDNDSLFKKHQGGVLIDGFSDSAYEKGLQEYLALKQQADHYRRIAMVNFDLEVAVDRYQQVYRQVCS